MEHEHYQELNLHLIREVEAGEGSPGQDLELQWIILHILGKGYLKEDRQKIESLECSVEDLPKLSPTTYFDKVIIKWRLEKGV